MLMSPLALDPAPAAVPAGDPAAGLPAAPAAGGDPFADQLAQAQSALPAGQNLAAGALPLKTLALSPGLEVITSPAGGPDGDSLAEFAKAQGLDDEVVAWLFSDATQAQMQAQALVAIPVPPGVMTLPGAAVAPADLALAPAIPSAPAMPSAPAILPPGLTAGAPGDADLLAAAAVTTAGWLQSQQAALGAAPAVTAPGAIDPAQAAASPLPGVLLAAAAATARGLRAEAAPTPLRLPAQDSGIPVEILSLDIQEGLESLWDDTGALSVETGSNSLTGAGAGTGTGASPGQGSGPGASAPGVLPEETLPVTTLAQRAAGYQELSQRLGEALAQRVMAQIERGNWEVRLLLRPARLGEVEIDLALRSGALDASFRATNPVTRDLLNDGLPRLREVLANAGMDIAGLNVGSGRSQHTGGNPTPRHARAPDGTMTAENGIMAVSAPAPQPRLRGTGSGWDVMV
jgi:flagellar hook-length control protein FliK